MAQTYINITMVANGTRTSFPVADRTTAGDLIGSANLRAAHNIPDNVDVIVGDNAVSSGYEFRDGDVVTFRTRASTKG
jgi:hypothetical protein